jgi:predicted RNA-binding protein with PUA-like domain
LLLKVLFDFAEANSQCWIYMTVLGHNAHLLEYLDDFGFADRGPTASGRETVLAKRRFPRSQDFDLPPLEFHITFGPPSMRTGGVRSFLVPIEPRYHARLFPEASRQLSLFGEQAAHGNGLRKAYLCNSNITVLRPGDVLYFYASGGQQTVDVVGVVEEVTRSSDPRGIVAAVGNRTLYQAGEIGSLSSHPDGVLAINFRQARVLENPISLSEMNRHEVVRNWPQSIQSISTEGAAWMANRIVQ